MIGNIIEWFMLKRINKKGIGMEYLIWMIIGIVVLVILITIVVILRNKGISADDFIKNLFRGR
jgi:hypothetical protein